MNYSIILKKIREKLLITQTELSVLLKCSFSSVNRWENGHYEPTMKVKRRIMQICKDNDINVTQGE